MRVYELSEGISALNFELLEGEFFDLCSVKEEFETEMTRIEEDRKSVV